MKEWENQFFVGVEPTTHNLNDYCSTTELEKRSNSFYDYLFIIWNIWFEPNYSLRGWRDSNSHRRSDSPVLVTNSTTPPIGARFLYDFAQNHLTTGNVAQKPTASRKILEPPGRIELPLAGYKAAVLPLN